MFSFCLVTTQAKLSFHFNTKKIITSVCVACEQNDLHPRFHLRQNPSIAPTTEILLQTHL